MNYSGPGRAATSSGATLSDRPWFFSLLVCVKINFLLTVKSAQLHSASCGRRESTELTHACVAEGLSGAVKLGDADVERLVVALGPVGEHADPYLLAQQNGSLRGA